MPVRFDAEIEVTRTGYYSMIFDGYIAKVPLFDDVVKQKLNEIEEAEKAEILVKSLVVDPSITEASYYKNGIFKVHWEKQGDLLKSKFIAFLRRNENMLSLWYVKTDGKVHLAGARAGQDQRKQLRDLGLDMMGEVRLITDATVVGHNADVVKEWPKKGPKFQMYTWKIVNIFTPSPSLTIQLHE
ncbi:MAG: hypothetical protein HOL54_06255 [Rhodospirillales bacterium]|nr:hypothetical protein [Rhodospirillales bacterium]MBT6826184.1 hypothetical protein [Rhodospirillales bacterium]